MSCSSCSSGLKSYVPTNQMSIIQTTGRVIGSRSLGNFASYVPATERSYIKTTGPWEGVPNATGGMHIGIHSRAGTAGLGTIFGDGQTNWIDGVANEYVVAAGALLILLTVMK